MTPKQKANELYNYYDDLLNKYYENPIVNDNQLKQCALKSVNEMHSIMISLWNKLGIKKNETSTYLLEIEKEIEKL